MLKRQKLLDCCIDPWHRVQMLNENERKNSVFNAGRARQSWTDSRIVRDREVLCDILLRVVDVLLFKRCFNPPPLNSSSLHPRGRARLG